jgi:hypothetical protein
MSIMPPSPILIGIRLRWRATIQASIAAAFVVEVHPPADTAFGRSHLTTALTSDCVPGLVDTGTQLTRVAAAA